MATGFLDRDAIADVVETPEGRNDLFIMGDHDDRSLELPGHGIEQVDNGESADAVKGGVSLMRNVLCRSNVPLPAQHLRP